MDAFAHAVVVGWLFHEDKTAEALAHGFSAWLRAVAGVKSDFRPASFFSDDDPAEHKAIRYGLAGLLGPSSYLVEICAEYVPVRLPTGTLTYLGLAGWHSARTCRSTSASGTC